MTLACELEMADADLPESPTKLLDEHGYAIMAMEAMKHSEPSSHGHYIFQNRTSRRWRNLGQRDGPMEDHAVP
jgi:hypothetical protein